MHMSFNAVTHTRDMETQTMFQDGKASQQISSKNVNTMRIQGKWYDVSTFQHPGGEYALSLGKGRDATALFELHHPFVPKAYLTSTLEKYELSPNELDKRGLELYPLEENDFKWTSSAFREDMKSSVKCYFDGITKNKSIRFQDSYKATSSHHFIMAVMILMALLSFPGYVRGEYWTFLVLPLLVWMTSASFTHDASHFCLSSDMRINQFFTHSAPWAASSSMWYFQHVIGHHAHTNIPGRDPDLYHGPTFWRYQPDSTWTPFFSYQTKIWPLIFCLGTMFTSYLNELWMDPIHYNGITSMKLDSYNSLEYRRHHLLRFAGLVLTIGAPLLYLQSLKGLLFSILMWCSLSFLFMMFTQVSHLDIACTSARDDDFWLHTLATTVDYECNSVLWNYITAGLNGQTIHHFFPTVHPCHYRYIYPIFKQVCLRHNVIYQEKISWKICFQDYLKALLYFSTDNQ